MSLSPENKALVERVTPLVLTASDIDDADLNRLLDAAREEGRANMDALANAARRAMPVLSDRYVGGRMVTPRKYAGDVFEEIKIALGLA